MTTAGRAADVLAAVAYGDAFAMPYEMYPRERIVALGGVDQLLPGHTDNPITAGLSAGQVTDDTIVTWQVAEAIIAGSGTADPIDVLSHTRAWQQAHPDVHVIGPSTLRAMATLDEGASLDQLGIEADTDGAAMRIAPVAIVAAATTGNDWAALASAVTHTCRATHHTQVALSGATAVAASIFHGLQGGALSGLVDAAKHGAVAGRAHGRAWCWPSIPARIDLALWLARPEVGDEEALDGLHHVLGTTVLTVDAVPAAIALAVRANGDVRRAAVMAANLGGDTDTIASMACAMVAAHVGLAGIPDDEWQQVAKVNELDVDDLAGRVLASAGVSEA